MSRNAWQGDVLYFIRKNIPHTQNRDFLNLYQSINNGIELAPARISEIINAVKKGKTGHLGRDEFVGKEDLFYERFFKDQDLDVVYHKLELFIVEENIDFPGSSRLPGDTNEEYILRFLKYGLANTYVPEVDSFLSNPDRAVGGQRGGGGLTPKVDKGTVPLSTNSVVHQQGGGGLLTDADNSLGEEPLSTGSSLDEELTGIDYSPNDEYGENTEYRSLENDHPQTNKIRVFVGKNWFALFLGIVLALSAAMYMTYTRTSLTDVFLSALNMPAPSFLFLALLLAAFPKAAGIAEAFIAYIRYRDESKNIGSFVNIAKYGTADTVLPGKGVFDSGSVNLKYGLISNMTGALCTVAFFFYASRLKGLADFIKDHPVNGFLLIIILISVGTAIIWNFMLQTRPVPEEPDAAAENPDNYLLNRLHVLATMVHLTFTLAFDGTIILYLFWYGFVSRRMDLSLDISFVFVIVTLFLYMWFASVSPYARDLQVDCTWIIHMTPLMSLLTLTYSIWFFKWSYVTLLCVLTNVVCLVQWGYYLKKKSWGCRI